MPRDIDRLVSHVRIRCRLMGESCPAEGHLRAAAQEVVSWHGPLGELKSSESEPLVAVVLGRAGQLSDGRPSADVVPTSLAQTPLQELAAETLQAAASPTIVRVRRALGFGEDPPFPYRTWYTEAAPWLENQVELERRKAPKWLADVGDDINKLREEAERIVAQLDRLTGENWTLDCWAPDLEFLAPDGQLARVWMTRHHTRLWPLAEASHELARFAGLPKWRVPPAVLCGIELTMPRATLRRETVTGPYLPGSARLLRSEVVLRLLTPDLTVAELAELHRTVREQWRHRGDPAEQERTRLTEDDLRLYRVLLAEGCDPRQKYARRSRGFWDRIAERWRGAGGEAAEKHALEMRARRLSAKLHRLLPLEGG